MSLQGTLDTFSLPDVLRLLAATGKSGHLHLELPRGPAAVALDRGRAAAITVPGAPSAVAPTPDVAVELLRATGGTFRFDAGDVTAGAAEPVDVEALLDDADGLLQDWRDVEAVVPSPSWAVTLVPALEAAVEVDPDAWQVVVAVGAGTTAASLADALGLGELATGRRIKDVVELGLLVVGPPDAGAATDGGSADLRSGVVDAHRSGALPEVAQIEGRDAHDLGDHGDPGAHDRSDTDTGDPATGGLAADHLADDGVATDELDRDGLAADHLTAVGPSADDLEIGAVGTVADVLATDASATDALAAGDLAGDHLAAGHLATDELVGDDVGSDDGAHAHDPLLEALGDAATAPSPAPSSLDADEVARRLSEPAPAADGASDASTADGQPVDRSALLKFLSSVRP